MEPRSVVAVLRLLVEINLLVVAAYALARLVAGPGTGGALGHRVRLRLAQAGFVLALLLPIAARTLPHGTLPLPAAQVWSSDDVGTALPEPVTYVGGAATIGGRRSLGVRSVALALALGTLLAGAAARLGWLGWRLLRLHRTLEALPAIRRIGRVVVVASPDESVPCSAWLFGRAYVVVPEALVADGSRRALAIHHEIAHHRQRDTIWVLLFEGCRAVTFWNPVMGPWARLFTELMELACDEALVARPGIDPRLYARCLVETARAALAPAPAVATTRMACGTSGTFLRRRIEMMLAPRTIPARRARALLAPLAALVLLAASALALEGSLEERVLGMEEARVLAARAETPDFPVVMNDRVLAKLNRLLGTPDGREFLTDALARMPEYRPAIEQRLSEAALPASLVAVALVESGFRNNEGIPSEPTIAPGMRGAGVWMFIQETAIRYGLRVDPARGIDERLDVAKETGAAIAYLGELHREFGDWHLALAAYNQGERHVARAIAEGGSREAFALSEQGRLNDYLATVMAGVVILANPEIVDGRRSLGRGRPAHPVRA